MMQISDSGQLEHYSIWSDNLCILECLGKESAVSMIRSNSEEFTQMLLKRPNIARELLEMALIPKHYQLTHQTLTLDNTYNSMEVLTSLPSSFTLYCVGELLPWMMGLEVDEGTPLSNLLRILTTLLYHQPGEFMKRVEKHQPKFLFTHLDNTGVIEFLLRVMEAEDDQSFFPQQKIALLLQSARIAAKASMVDVLEGYAGLLGGLAQKTEDRFDGSKFVDFFKQAFSQAELTNFIVPLYLQHQGTQLGRTCMQVMEAYLRFTVPDCSTSLLPQSFLRQMGVVLSEKVPPHEGIYLVFYLQSLGRLVKLDGISLKNIITSPLVDTFVRLMPMHPSNTIIHNLVKDILICLINKNPHYFGLMLVEEGSMFMELLGKVSPNNSAAAMENALYHVYNALVQTSHPPILDVFKKDCYEEMVVNLQEKKMFYETKIGGNPRVDSAQSSGEFVFGGAGMEILKAWGIKETHSDDDDPKSEGEELPLSSNGAHQLDDVQLKLNSQHSFELKLNSTDPEPNPSEQQQLIKEEASFMKHFSSYVQFDVDSLIDQMN